MALRRCQGAEVCVDVFVSLWAVFFVCRSRKTKYWVSEKNKEKERESRNAEREFQSIQCLKPPSHPIPVVNSPFAEIVVAVRRKANASVRAIQIIHTPTCLSFEAPKSNIVYQSISLSLPFLHPPPSFPNSKLKGPGLYSQKLHPRNSRELPLKPSGLFLPCFEGFINSHLCFLFF